MKSKTIIIIFSVILVLSICTGSIVIVINKIKQTTDNNIQNTEKSQNSETTNNSRKDEDNNAPSEEKVTEEKEHNLTLKIISPEEEVFSVRQARYYNALAEGNTKHSNQVKCHWDFYLDQNNGEALYQTMDNSGILSGESKELCGFTSTFIEASGKLRVVLTVTVYNAINDNLETVTAERSYIVK